MIYQNDDDEFKRAAEIIIYSVFGILVLAFFVFIGLGFYLIFG